MGLLSGLVVLAGAGGIFLLVSGSGPSAASAVNQVEVVQTGGSGPQRLAHLRDLTFRGRPPERGLPVIAVDDRVRYQHVRGFGAAMTDTSAWLLQNQLSPGARAAVMSELFGPRGIRLGFLRVPMGASDFTQDRTPYSYDDMPAGQRDPSLSHFSIAHDQAYIIPALRQALALNPRLELLSGPWSPPAWMKANASLSNQGNRGLLLPSAYAPWAQYFVKFVRAYARAGIPIAAITPQNEPTNPTMYPGLNLDSAREATFVERFLAPALRRDGLHTKIYGGDVGVDTQASPSWSVIGGQRVEFQSGRDYVAALEHSGAARALSGVAWHCYYGTPEVMSALHRTAPGQDLVVDECSPGITPFSISELVISGLRNWASVVALWNVALDRRGGPVQPPNRGCPVCSGVVTVDGRRGTAKPTRSLAELGQASKFVQPGAQRIASGHFVGYRYLGPGTDVVSSGLDDVALLNPDGSRVLIAYDNSARPIRFAVTWRGRSFSYTLTPKSTVTFVWNRRH